MPLKKIFQPHYLLIPLAAFATALVGSMITSAGMDWYKTIILPVFAPPGAVIGAVWTVIFIMLAASAIIVWDKKDKFEDFQKVKAAYLINVIINVLWSAVFFGLHRIGSAFIVALFLWMSVIYIMKLVHKESSISAWLLSPYAAWVAFASFLNFMIWTANMNSN